MRSDERPSHHVELVATLLAAPEQTGGREVDLRARDARDARASVDDETRDVVTRVVSRASGELERGGARARVRV